MRGSLSNVAARIVTVSALIGCASSAPMTGPGATGEGGRPAGGDAGGDLGQGMGGATGAAGSGGSGPSTGTGGAGGAPVDAGHDLSGAGGNASQDAGRTTGSGGATDAGLPPGLPPPPFTGPATSGTVTVTRASMTGRLGPRFAGFSFEKSHMTDGFFTGTNAPLIALFRLLGPGVVRIGANDVDRSVWQPSATPVRGGTTTNNVGTADVDALAAFLTATGWQVIYGVNMKTSTPAAAVAEATYATSRLGTALVGLEIGNEINFFGAYATVRPQWEAFATAVHAALPNAPLAAPATAGDLNFSVQFARDEAARMVLLTHHYYRGGAGSAVATMANLLAADPVVTSQSQALSGAVTGNNIRDGFRWGEMNSFSGHGQAGVSDAFGSALWSIDFMLTTAQYGAAGVNFHGGGQNMDGNNCANGVASCTRPFRYSPIIEVDSKVTAAAPLFYGMLLVSQAGVGNMLATRASAGNLNFTAYSIAPADGSTNVVLVNKDANMGINASVDVGAPLTGASAVFLEAPSLTATTGVTLAGAGISPTGAWSPQPAYSLPVQGNVVTLTIPPGTAVIVRAR